ncbi:MAG: MlaE family lipid ABC transporter permease subunit [Hyphomicrobiaceae bacterium]|nr:MAG: MlaE family lipid ABC transporter permease subunit [Hyphomicrobiaceae bacterium]
MSSEPLLSRAFADDRLELAAAGSWTAVHANELEALVDGIARDAARSRSAAIDMRRVHEFDTFGAWLLERLVRESKALGQDMQIVGLPARFQGLLDEVHRTGGEGPPPPAAPNPLLRALEALGRGVAETGRELVPFINMLGALCIALIRVIVHPRAFRLTSAVHHVDRVGWQAVPIILLITFLIGCIIAQQGFFHFRKFGADVYVVDMVGILVLRELGVLIVAIMVAGRSGSSYTAELGSMKMREEIDALRTMGFDPVEVLVLPRVVALVIALPLLTFLGSMAALYGGGLVAWLYGGMSPEIFIDRLKEAISVTHFRVGMIKAPFMALVIGIIACSEGFRVLGSAESLGVQTTTSVVKSIFLVIVLDGVFAIFFASIDM